MPVLQVDHDGNGSVDQQVIASGQIIGPGATDQTPPQTGIKITGIIGSDNWFRSDVQIELLARDETNGSGIAKVEYSLDNGQTIQTYTQPITISQEDAGKIKYRSIDNAGNEEVPKEAEIKIDKTPPTISLSANPNQL